MTQYGALHITCVMESAFLTFLRFQIMGPLGKVGKRSSQMVRQLGSWLRSFRFQEGPTLYE